MTVKDRLHQWVDALPEEQAGSALELLEANFPLHENGRDRVSQEEHRRRVLAALGSMAHVPGSVDEFIRLKQEDIDREEEKYERSRSHKR